MIGVNDIQPGRIYGRSDQVTRRRVRSVAHGTVEYEVEGVFTFMPLRIPLEEFAAWADWTDEPTDDRSPPGA